MPTSQIQKLSHYMEAKQLVTQELEVGFEWGQPDFRALALNCSTVQQVDAFCFIHNNSIIKMSTRKILPCCFLLEFVYTDFPFLFS